MSATQYIVESLKQLQNNSPNVVKDGNIIDAIYGFLMSKKFRKYAVNSEYFAHVRTAIKTSVEKHEPIKLTLVFGGYKLWRLKEAPEVDWAELFSLIYYTHWLKPIATLYKPGVWFDFYSDDVILEIMDNVPKKDTETYINSFKNLLNFIKPYIPKNLHFTLNRVGDQYTNYEEFKAELAKLTVDVKKDLGGLPKLTSEQMCLVELNVKLNPGQDSDPEWREKVFLIHEAYSKVTMRRPYYRTPDKSFVITRPIKDSIAVGTTKTSVAKFWVGAGALKKDNGSYKQYVLSPKQLASHSFTYEQVHIEGLDSKNFKTIRLFS